MKFETHTHEIELRTNGKGTYEVSDAARDFLNDSRLVSGQMTLFVRHTSASLVIMENADCEARTDLHAFFDHLVPEDLPFLVHTYEGPDDSPSHLRMALTRTSEVIPIHEGKLALGTWQGIFLFEHRRAPHTRKIMMSLVGTPDH